MSFLNRYWQNRWVRRFVGTVVALVTFFALLTACVSWSASRRWRAAQAMLKAEGETLDFRALMKEPLPEVENFCAIPLLKDVSLTVDGDGNKVASLEMSDRLAALALPPQRTAAVRPRLGDCTSGSRADLEAWADWLRKDGLLAVPTESGDGAVAVLAALATRDAVVEGLAAGLNRTKAQWTPEWKTRELPELLFTVALPHFSQIVGANETLALRAIAAARTGDATKAHESAQVSARLNLACLNDPFILGLVVGRLGTSNLCAATWEFCDMQAGTAADFARLESSLAGLDLHGAALHAIRGELAAMVDAIQYLKIRPSDFGKVFGLSSGLGGTRKFATDQLLGGFSKGFFDTSSAVFVELEYRYVIEPLKESGWLKAIEAGNLLQTKLAAKKRRIWMHPSYILASAAIPATTNIVGGLAYTDAQVKMAIIGCALERHRIAHGSYPGSLDTVRLADGQPLPFDPMDGKPMRYRKTADGRYALWSVAFDGKDDGGIRTSDGRKPAETKFSDAKFVGDWVWDFPAAPITPSSVPSSRD